MNTNYAENKLAQLRETLTDNAVGNPQLEVSEMKSNSSETCTGDKAPRAEDVIHLNTASPKEILYNL